MRVLDLSLPALLVYAYDLIMILFGNVGSELSNRRVAVRDNHYEHKTILIH